MALAFHKSTFWKRQFLLWMQARFKSNSLVRTSDPFHACTETIDVRSPQEFEEDHIPGARNCPVLSDRERVEVGTRYSVNAFQARKEGARLVMLNISRHLADYFQQQAESYQPLVYCWRGGQRSRSLAQVLAEIGFQVYVLEGGYKRYRQQVCQDLNSLPGALKLKVITGLTGSGKTRLLEELKKKGAQVLDLEGLAHHKGSLLGEWVGTAQPSQKAFESALHQTLVRFDPTRPVWVESESRKVGARAIPQALFERMSHASRLEISVPMEERVKFILEDYPYWTEEPEQLKKLLSCLTKVRGHQKVQQWMSLVDAQRWEEFIESILREHYDLSYGVSLKRGGRVPPEQVLQLSDLSPQTLHGVAISLHVEKG